MNKKGTWALATSLPKFQIHWLLMVACWANDAEMAQDIVSYARMQCPNMSHTKISLLLNNLELWNGKSTWTLIQILFRSSKMVGCQHWHVQWMVCRWPGTSIYVHRCIWLGRHGLKLVRYTTESFEAQEAFLPRRVVANWGKLSNGKYTGDYNLQAQKCSDKNWPTFPSDITIKVFNICFDQGSATPGL